MEPTKVIENKEKNPKRRGLIIVNTGNGKGKTTAAMGVGFRAAGNNMKVIMIQFIKGVWKTGEQKSAKKLGNFELIPMGEGFTWDTKNPQRDTEIAMKAWNFAKERIMGGEYDLVILDEINYAMDYNYLPVREVIDCLKQKPKELHVILTGRNAKPELIEIADLVTEMKEIKHPYSKGIKAQRGIEF